MWSVLLGVGFDFDVEECFCDEFIVGDLWVDVW